jgi:hypothetical protein
MCGLGRWSSSGGDAMYREENDCPGQVTGWFKESHESSDYWCLVTWRGPFFAFGLPSCLGAGTRFR